MKIFQQLKLACISAPLSLSKIKRRSAAWLGIYSLCALVAFGIFISLMLLNQEAIKNALLDYFFPQSWHQISVQLGNFLFESQTKVVLSNLIISGSLVFASILLFPIKEKYSAEFEKDAKFDNGESKEFPLIYQAWEESKLFILYITAQSFILWLGYYPYQWTTILSITLSYLFLFFTFGLDFISPTLQRHRTKYSIILKALFFRPLLTLSFGLIFCFPLLILSQFIFTYETLTLIEIISILFLANILFLTIAIPAGTKIASLLLKDIKSMSAIKRQPMLLGYSMMLLVLTSTLYLHSQLIVSLHHKSQLLKAEYQIDWSSFNYNLPSFSQLTNETASSHLSFEVIISNPTQYDIKIEDSQIYVMKTTQTIAQFDLDGFEVPAGKSQRVTMKLNSVSNLGLIKGFSGILEDWRVDIHIQVWKGIPFIINAVSSE